LRALLNNILMGLGHRNNNTWWDHRNNLGPLRFISFWPVPLSNNHLRHFCNIRLFCINISRACLEISVRDILEVKDIHQDTKMDSDNLTRREVSTASREICLAVWECYRPTPASSSSVTAQSDSCHQMIEPGASLAAPGSTCLPSPLQPLA